MPPPPSRQPNPPSAPGQIGHHRSQQQPHGNQTHANRKPTTDSTATLIASTDCTAIAEDLWVERELLTETKRESRVERGGGKREKERKKEEKKKERREEIKDRRK